MSEFCDNFGNLARREKLARLFSGIGSEALYKEDISVTENVFRSVREVEAGFSKILQQRLESTVSVLCLAEIGFGIEVDGTEKAAELTFVSFFNRIENDVNQFPNIF